MRALLCLLVLPIVLLLGGLAPATARTQPRVTTTTLAGPVAVAQGGTATWCATTVRKTGSLRPGGQLSVLVRSNAGTYAVEASGDPTAGPVCVTTRRRAKLGGHHVVATYVPAVGSGITGSGVASGFDVVREDAPGVGEETVVSGTLTEAATDPTDPTAATTRTVTTVTVNRTVPRGRTVTVCTSVAATDGTPVTRGTIELVLARSRGYLQSTAVLGYAGSPVCHSFRPTRRGGHHVSATFEPSGTSGLEPSIGATGFDVVPKPRDDHRTSTVRTLTSLDLDRRVKRGTRATACATVRIPSGTGTPAGTVAITVRRDGRSSYLAGVVQEYAGTPVCVSTGRLHRLGDHVVEARYEARPGTVFESSQTVAGFDVVARPRRDATRAPRDTFCCGAVGTTTSLELDRRVERGTRATACATVTIPVGTAVPVGTMTITIRRNARSHLAGVVQEYTGTPVCVSTGRLHRLGAYVVEAFFQGRTDSVFNDSQTVARFKVTPRPTRPRSG